VDDEGAGQVHAAVASDVTAETAHRVDAGSHAPTRASKRQNGHSACVANTADLNEAILQGFTRDVIESDSAFEVLVRGWLWIDKALSALILAPLEAPEQLSQDALDWMRFEHKIQLAAAQGSLTWPSPLRALARIRNRLAHNPHVQVDAALVEELASSFEPDFGRLSDGTVICNAPELDTPKDVVERLRGMLTSIVAYLFELTREMMDLRVRELGRQVSALRRAIDERTKQGGS
jgi:hypothetical protein